MALALIQTKRLTLRPCGLDDVDALHQLWIDPDVRRYLWDDIEIPRERAEATVCDAMESSAQGLGLWLVIERATDALAGFCGLIRREREGEPELLYGLAPAFWGRGFATEAAQAALAYAFGTLGAARVTATMDPPNVGSVGVMMRLGFHFVRRDTLNNLDTSFYEIARNEFLTAQAGTARR
jgi:ribosomal-protein-alanine N-acetyltransferase